MRAAIHPILYRLSCFSYFPTHAPPSLFLSPLPLYPHSTDTSRLSAASEHPLHILIRRFGPDQLALLMDGSRGRPGALPPHHHVEAAQAERTETNVSVPAFGAVTTQVSVACSMG